MKLVNIIEQLKQTTLYKKLIETFNTQNIRGLIARGGMWLGAGGASEHGLRLIRTMILTRLIAPDAFGLMAIVLATNALFESFTQIGIKESVIQNLNGNKTTYLNGAFWLASVRGIALYTIAVIVVPWVAHFYSSSELVPMMRIAFLGIIFNGAMSPKSYTELKKMNYKKWVILFHGGGIIGILTAIVLGFVLQNVWALVFGFVVESGARCFLSYVLCPFRPRFNFESDSLHSLFSFARGIFGLPILVFLYYRLDIFVIGKLCSAEELGMYSIAYSLVQIPFLLFSTIISPLLLPTFSLMQHNHFLLAGSVIKSSRYLTWFFLPLLTIMACFSSQLLTLFFGEPYGAMSRIFMILCASIAIRIIGTVIVSAFFALGKPQYTREASIIRVVLMLILVIPLVMTAGPLGAAVASLISASVWLFVSLVRIQSIMGLSITKYIYSLSGGIFISLSIGGLWLIYIII